MKGDERAAQERAAALAEFYKALKAITFYPESHPLREEILRRAFLATTRLMDGDKLTVAVHRNGLALEGAEEGVEETRMVMSLAKELFTREIQRLTMLPGIDAAQFTAFLSLLALEPQRIIAEGGMAAILERHGIGAVIANEIDIAAVFTRRKVGEAPEEMPLQPDAGGEAAREGEVPGTGEPPDDFPLDRLENLAFGEIAALMEQETDETRYRQLARLLVAKGNALKQEGHFDPLFPVLISLLNQNADATRSTALREISLEAFLETVRGGTSDHLLGHLENESFNKHETVYLILNRLGGEVVEEIVHRIAETESQHARKCLTTALLRIGVPAVRPLLTLLQDDRRKMVRVAVAVLGDMGNRDAVKGLTLTAYHTDSRIRFESIRSLAQVGGKEATDVLLDLLNDSNRAIRRQAILWLGISRNEQALQPLMDLVWKRDFRGKIFTLKKEALLAVGRIGDRRALESLFRLVRKRRLLAASGWEDLKLLAVETIGRLGGNEAREFLKKTVSRGGRLGRACNAMLESFDERTGESHE